ncbi:MAG: hypothetical protein ACR2LC_00840 [Pyrinomonadaceae bacterium]
MTKLIIVILMTLFCAPQSFSSQLPAAKVQQTNQGEIDVRVAPFVDLYYFISALASGSEKPPEIDGFAQAVEAARPLRFAPRLINIVVIRCDNASDAARVFAQLPETVKVGAGQTLLLREKAVNLAKALAVIEKPFLEKIWPQHKLIINQAAASISKTFKPKEQECFAYITKNLGMQNVAYKVPVYLVADAPLPGGFTFRQDDGSGVCLISVERNKGSLLFETLLHEAIHALDLEAKGNGNVLIDIRNRLLKAGITERDPDMRNVPHTLMFIQAAETVRRLLDSSHKHYGDVSGYYAKVPLIAKIERPIWIDYLDGKISREKALNQIVDEFLKARAGLASPKTPAL